MNISIKPVFLAVALACCAGLPGTAAASSVIGATEPTQIANNVELIASYQKQIEQVVNQVRQYQAQLRAFQRLDPSKLKDMLRGVAGGDVIADLERNLRAASDTYNTLNSINTSMETLRKEGAASVDVIRRMRERGIEVSGSEYLAAFSHLADEKQGMYAQRKRAMQGAIEQVRSDARRIEAIQRTAPEIETHVQGFSALVQTNGIMSGQLAQVSQVLMQQASDNLEIQQAQIREMDRAEMERASHAEWKKSVFGTGQGQRSETGRR